MHVLATADSGYVFAIWGSTSKCVLSGLMCDDAVILGIFFPLSFNICCCTDGLFLQSFLHGVFLSLAFFFFFIFLYALHLCSLDLFDVLFFFFHFLHRERLPAIVKNVSKTFFFFFFQCVSVHHKRTLNVEH